MNNPLRAKTSGLSIWTRLILASAIVAGGLTLALGLLVSDLMPALASPARITVTNNQPATLVLGQANFITNSLPLIPAPTSMASPNGVAVDPTTGKVFVADTGNARILRFKSVISLTVGAAAEAVLGQSSFITDVIAVPPTQASLNGPQGLYVDASGNLWVADSGNSRVLLFTGASTLANGANANVVLGQADFVSNNPGFSSIQMSNPTGVFVDSGGRLWVADTGNSRVLRFDNAASLGIDAPANGVLGQPDMINPPTPATTQSGLDVPVSVFVDSGGRLWVADAMDNRVLRFDSAASLADGANAGGVLGQSLFTTATPATTQGGMSGPYGLTGDAPGNLYVSDQVNNRVLVYNNAAAKADGGNADTVLGQSGFTTGGAGTSATTFNAPGELYYDPAADVLWVPEFSNNRVLMFGLLVRSTPNPSTFGNAVVFTATVDNGATTAVTFFDGATQIGSGTANGGTPTIATLSISTLNAGQHPITAQYGGGSTVVYTQTVNQATPTLSITNSPVTYTAAPQAATLVANGLSGIITGTTGNVLYNTSATVPTAAGTYSVTANFTSTNPNYTNLTGAGAGNFVINKATPALAVSNSPVTYTAAAQAALITPSTPGTVSNVLYNGSPVTPTAAGTYAVTANFAPNDTANFNSLTSASAGSFVINKATPSLTITNSPVTYNGLSQTAVVTATGGVTGTVSNILYSGSATAPIAASTYAVTANFVPRDSTNYNSLTAASAGNFVINPIPPTLAITNSPVTYTGSAQAATLVANGLSGIITGTTGNVLYNTSATVPTAAGTYSVTANFTSTNPNYTNLTGALAGNFVINKATPVLTVTNSPVLYDGLSHAAVVTATGVAGTVGNVAYSGLGSTAPTAVGTYTVTAAFTPTDGVNYNSLPAGTSAGTFAIVKATPVLTITNSPVTYDGLSHAAVVTATGGVTGTIGNIRYAGSATPPTNAGTYAVTAAFTPTLTAYYNTLPAGTSVGSFVINPIPPTLAITNSPVTYTGSAQAATIVANGLSGAITGTVGNVLYNTSATVPTAAGTYSVTANFTSTNPNYTNLTGALAGNFVINKATPVLTVTNSPVLYDGLSHAAVVTATGVAGTVGNVAYSGLGSTAPTAVGTYTVTAAFTPTDGVNYNSLPAGTSAGTFAIVKATPVLTITNSPVTYDGLSHAAVVTATGGVTGTIGNIRYAGSATPPTNAGTYAVTAAFTPTLTAYYNTLPAGTSVGSFVINPIPPTLAITNSPVTYTGSAQAATIVANGLSGAITGSVGNVLYNNSATSPINAGTYTVTAVFTSTNPNYTNLPVTSLGNFVINKANPRLVITNPTVPCTGIPQPAVVTSTVSGIVSNILYSGTVTVPVACGNYLITANFAPTDTANYNTLVDAPVGNFVISFRVYLPVIRKP